MVDTFQTEDVVRDDFIGVMLISAMTEMDNDPNCPYSITHSADKKSVEVELRIDGHEVSMRDFLQKLERAFDQAVSSEAVGLAEKRCGDLLERLHSFQEDVMSSVRDKFPEVRREEY